MRFAAFLFLTLFALNASAYWVSENIVSVYATFQQKTTHDNMTINYLATKRSKTPPRVTLISEHGDTGDELVVEGRMIELPKQNGAFVYSTEITGLTANTTYFFSTGDDANGWVGNMSFTTLPNDDTPIVLMQGGDMGSDSDIEIVPQTALKNNPDVILIGGDLAYADGDHKKFNRWLRWFNFMNEVMMDDNGHLTPLILAIGNHETNSIVGDNKKRIPYFFRLFPQNGNRAYFSRVLGANSLLMVLDSGHGAPPAGKQRLWIEEEFRANMQYNNKLALYHIPMYPGNRKYALPPSNIIRSSWRRVFDKYELDVAFENHDHVYKRTHMLRDNKVVDHNGTVFVGDGCWGRKTRSTENRWYIHASSPGQNVWSAILEPDMISLQATGKDAFLFDEFHIDTANRVVIETEWYLRGLPRQVQELLQ